MIPARRRLRRRNRACGTARRHTPAQHRQHLHPKRGLLASSTLDATGLAPQPNASTTFRPPHCGHRRTRQRHPHHHQDQGPHHRHLPAGNRQCLLAAAPRRGPDHRYDVFGRQIASTDARGNTTTLAYDPGPTPTHHARGVSRSWSHTTGWADRMSPTHAATAPRTVMTTTATAPKKPPR